MQEAKQVERQQHLEEQHRLHISAGWQDQLNTTNGTAAGNGTDHVDDFMARIDKLRQVRPPAFWMHISYRILSLCWPLRLQASCNLQASKSNDLLIL